MFIPGSGSGSPASASPSQTQSGSLLRSGFAGDAVLIAVHSLAVGRLPRVDAFMAVRPRLVAAGVAMIPEPQQQTVPQRLASGGLGRESIERAAEHAREDRGGEEQGAKGAMPPVHRPKLAGTAEQSLRAYG